MEYGAKELKGSLNSVSKNIPKEAVYSVEIYLQNIYENILIL